jgi:hypothetical protein
MQRWPLLGILTLLACGRTEASGTAPSASVLAAAAVAPVPAGSAGGKADAPALPAVDLAGVAHPVPRTLPGSPRLHVRGLRIPIHERPDPASTKIGYLRLGTSAPTSAEPAGRAGCPGGWYSVAPRGFVCAGQGATLSAEDPAVQIAAEWLPEPGRKLPWIYGTVRKPGPIYQRLPTRDELAAAEPGYEARMEEWLAADGEIGASYAQHVWLGHPGEIPDPRAAWAARKSDGVPSFLENGKRLPGPALRNRGEDLVIDRMKPRTGYSFLRTFFWEGRRYGLTTDLRLMPTDRLRPIQGSENRGVRIGVDVDFPFALVRREGAEFKKREKGRLGSAGPAPYFKPVKLSGKKGFFGGRLHYETADGLWISDKDASPIEPAKRMPRWGTNGEKWIDVNVTTQRLVLYEGTKPVYATLVSSGEAGLEDPEHTTATKRGIFRIHTKHVSATMDSEEIGEEFELRDVPYVMYFDQEGYALHGAYWHDRFGTPKSHGCINLTPEDARRIFYWTEPQLPVGWHSVLQPLTGTVIFVHP